MSGADFEFGGDRRSLVRSVPSSSDPDPETPSAVAVAMAASPSPLRTPTSARRSGVGDVLRHLDRGLSNRGRFRRHVDRGGSPAPVIDQTTDDLGDGAPPEWALLLIGCLLGLATGICVAAFNRGVYVIHEWAWAGTPNEGAAWLRLQRLADTWHRILLIPVTGGVVVGMMHGLLEIFEQIKQSRSTERHGIDFLAGIFPTIKAVQAAITLGTGCSLGPEGPSVEIGKSCAKGCSEMMENNRERRIALVAAGAAAGIASGFNAAVAGCFFAIETVLRPLRAENSPPFTTAMIILASVISSTVSNVLLGEKPAFVVPTYELKSAAGLIALKYPGILYWGFTNVEEILHTGKSASAPGIWLLTQLVGAKVVATSLCKGSGLVGGLYAPSLMIGAAVGAVFGGLAAELINSAIPGNAAVAQPQAYALVGMAATLASVCSVPLTSVLLLFELTKDYRILLPLMGAVGLAIWVPSVTNQPMDEPLESRLPGRGYSSLTSAEDKNEARWGGPDRGDDLELTMLRTDTPNHETYDEEMLLDDLKVSQAMSKNYVKVDPSVTVKEAIKLMHDKQQRCVLVVDHEDFLEGILTTGDIRRKGLELFVDTPRSPKGGSPVLDVNSSLISSCLTRGFHFEGSERGLLTCFPDTDLTTAKELMEAKGIKQLPVVKRGGSVRNDGKRRLIALLHYDSISRCLREEVERWKIVYQRKEDFHQMAINGH